MAILWTGAEASDFLLAQAEYSTSLNYNRSGYSRLAYILDNDGPQLIGLPITPVSSCWLSTRHGVENYVTEWCGLINWENNAFIGYKMNSSNLALFTYDGSTSTTLATGSLTMDSGLIMYKIDMQVSNYGPSGSVNVWVNGILDIQYSGNIAVNGQTTLDRFWAYNASAIYSSYNTELIIADEDTRAMSLVTLTPNAVGDTNDWNGTYEDIDDYLQVDENNINTDTVEDDALFALSDSVAGDYQIKAVNISCRAADADANRGIQIGVKTNGALHFGSTHNLNGGWSQYNNILHVNPETSQPFTVAEINALQVAFRSKTP